MKTVFDNAMVVHVWAQQNQPAGRNANGSFYFDGRTIYSYGRHFPIAKFVRNDKGERAVLITTRTYSITTAKHINDVHAALRGDTLKLYVNDPSGSCAQVFEDAVTAVNANLQRAARTAARYRQKWLDKAVHAAAMANAYFEFFGLARRVVMPELSPEFIAETTKAHKELLAFHNREMAHRAKVNAERVRLEGLVSAERLKLWMDGDPAVTLWYRDTEGRTLLRVIGDTVETSRGAEVPLSQVAKAMRVWRLAVDANALPWTRGDFAQQDADTVLGQFTLDKITTEGDVHAGCHTIERAEIERLEALLAARK